VQSLHWAIKDRAQCQTLLYVSYLNFESAFNSPDHVWRLLRDFNVPDADLLRALYKAAHYVADLPYGRSAPVFLTRGSKQSDKLSPCSLASFSTHFCMRSRPTEWALG
jgi:hypothetical protein